MKIPEGPSLLQHQLTPGYGTAASDKRSRKVATVATWLMTLFIQRAEHRDTQAIHAKLDELLRVEGRARSELTQLDDEEPEAIEQHRSEERT